MTVNPADELVKDIEALVEENNRLREYIRESVNVFTRTADQIDELEESIHYIREYLDIMANEPDGYIKISEVYHHIRRILGDE